MANILVVIPGQSEPNLCSKSVADLMRWHRLAEARSPSGKK